MGESVTMTTQNKMRIDVQGTKNGEMRYFKSMLKNCGVDMQFKRYNSSNNKNGFDYIEITLSEKKQNEYMEQNKSLGRPRTKFIKSDGKPYRYYDIIKYRKESISSEEIFTKILNCSRDTFYYHFHIMRLNIKIDKYKILFKNWDNARLSEDQQYILCEYKKKGKIESLKIHNYPF